MSDRAPGINLPPAGFPHAPRGRRGYDPASVEAFVAEVATQRRAVDEQLSSLKAEVERLHRYIRRQWSAVAAAEAGAEAARPGPDGAPVSPAAQAAAVLSQAQETADERIAEATRQAQRQVSDAHGEAARRLRRADAIAERMLAEARQVEQERRQRARERTRRLLRLARTRYEDIVLRAHQRADRAAEAVLAELREPGATVDGAGRDRVELEMKAAYLRTFAKVSRAALQEELEVTAREFERLLGAEDAAVPVAPPVAGEASSRTPVAGAGAPTADSVVPRTRSARRRAERAAEAAARTAAPAAERPLDPELEAALLPASAPAPELARVIPLRG